MSTELQYYYPLTEDELLEFINKQKWIFAKTMPKNPHEYALLKNSRTEEEQADFIRFAINIDKFGVPRKWFKQTYTYLVVGDYEYWSMDATPMETDLINRALVKNHV